MTATVWAVVLLGGLATYLIRVSFLAFADRATDLPPVVATALRMIPPAALAALTVPAIARTDGAVDLASPRVLAGIVAAAVAWRTRNPILTMVVGIGLLAVLEQV